MSGTLLPKSYYSDRSKAKRLVLEKEIPRLANVYYESLSEEQKAEMLELFNIVTNKRNRSNLGRNTKDLINKLIDDYGVPLPVASLTNEQRANAQETRSDKELLIRGLTLLLYKKQEEERVAKETRRREAMQRMRNTRAAEARSGVNLTALRAKRANKTARQSGNLLNFVSVSSRPGAPSVNPLNVPPYTAAQMQLNLAEVFNPAAGAPANHAGGRRRKHKTMKRRRS